MPNRYETTIDGQRVILDAADADHLAGRIWHVRPVGRTQAPRVVSYTRENGKFRMLLLHRMIMGDPPGFVIFASGDPFDLRRSNLVLSDRPGNTIACPFTPDRLRELYWGEALSRGAIGMLAGQAIGHGRPICYEAVDRWLKEAGLKLRTRREALILRHRNGREAFAEWQRRAVQRHAARVRAGIIQPRVDHLHTIRVKRRAKRCQKQRARPAGAGSGAT